MFRLLTRALRPVALSTINHPARRMAPAEAAGTPAYLGPLNEGYRTLVEAAALAGRAVEVEASVSRPWVPKDLGINPDPRELGIRVRSFGFLPGR